MKLPHYSKTPARRDSKEKDMDKHSNRKTQNTIKKTKPFSNNPTNEEPAIGLILGCKITTKKESEKQKKKKNQERFIRFKG